MAMRSYGGVLAVTPAGPFAICCNRVCGKSQSDGSPAEALGPVGPGNWTSVAVCQWMLRSNPYRGGTRSYGRIGIGPTTVIGSRVFEGLCCWTKFSGRVTSIPPVQPEGRSKQNHCAADPFL